MGHSSNILRQLVKEEIDRYTISENQIENLLGPDDQLHEDLVAGLQQIQAVAPMVVMLSLGGAVTLSSLKVAYANMILKKDQAIAKYLRNAEDPEQAQGKLLHSLMTAPAATAGKIAKKVFNTITGKVKKDKEMGSKLAPLVQQIQNHPDWDKVQASLKKYETDRRTYRTSAGGTSSPKSIRDFTTDYKNFEEAMKLARNMFKEIIKDNPLDPDVEKWVKEAGEEWPEAVDDDILKMIDTELKTAKADVTADQQRQWDKEKADRNAIRQRNRAASASKQAAKMPGAGETDVQKKASQAAEKREKDYLF